MGGTCSSYGRDDKCCSKEKRTLKRHRHKGEGNIIKLDPKWGGRSVDWTHLAQCRDQERALVNAVMKLRSS